MKLISKIMVPVIGVMATSSLFAGCAQNEPEVITKEILFTDAINNFKKNEALATDADVNMELKIESSGFYITVTNEGSFNIEGDFKNEVVHSDGDMTVSVFGQGQNIHSESYTTREDNSAITYTCQTTSENDPKEWSYTKNETENIGWTQRLASINTNDKEFKDKLAEFAKGLTFSNGTTKVDGTDCYVVKGIASLENDMLSDLPEGMSAVKTDDTVMADSVWYFNKKNHELQKVELDLASAIESVASELEDVKLTPVTCNVVMDFTYDSKINLLVPDDIKESAKERVDSDDAIEMLTQF